MRVVLDAASVPRMNRVDLMVLLWIVSLGRHRAMVDDERHPAYAEWLAGLPEDVRADWSAAIESSLLEDARFPSHHEIHVAHRTHSAWGRPVPSLTMVDALTLLLSPYRVLVESGFSDRAFLLSLCEREQRGFLEDRLSREWLEIEHGGGIEDLRKRVEQVRGDTGRRMRYSVLFDSDALQRDSPSLAAIRAKEACENGAPRIVDLQVHHHRLHRRAIENYLPKAALERWRDSAQGGEQRRRRDLVRAFFSLTEEQRSFFHVKAGFTKQCAPGLFDGLDRRARETLEKGFDNEDEKVSDVYRGLVQHDDFNPVHPDVEAVRKFIDEMIQRMR